ncbi:hypothetical protein ACH5RR_010628 [Cinchona calisaya]|uniref:Replication factor A C-terminal domain-containing protein n=1 Tax=Cinchona calisaya TaxID=153742 RepID=A0ABD3AJJ5_9GENT
MAINEGGLLENQVGERLIVAITDVQKKEFQGKVQLHTSDISTIDINPACQQFHKLQKWFTTKKQKSLIEELLMIKMFENTQKINLEDVIQNRQSLKEGALYYFIGTVDMIENKSKPWYDACQNCTRSVIQTNDGVECRSCSDAQIVQRYRLTLNIILGTATATVTLFEDAATVYIGCSVNDYIQSTAEDEKSSKYFRDLETKSNKQYKFLIQLDERAQTQDNHLIVVAEAIERIQPKQKEETKQAVPYEKKRTKKNLKTNNAPIDKSIKIDSQKKGMTIT